jgi:uncharacterized protein
MPGCVSTTPRAKNRLAQETSPYLLQHSENPVDWYPWGPEALELSKRTDRPIFLSIGYSACHWCHVMERESFENEAIARRLNELFVCIKVDREERPDLDEIYMSATVALSGSGGWPMSVFLTPDQRPFFAGTYFPPTDRWGRSGLLSVIERLHELWMSERETLLDQAEQLTLHVRAASRASRPEPVVGEAIERAVAELSRSFDAKWGGFGRAPKFPPTAALQLLLRTHHRTRDARALEMAVTTLTRMKDGGIYDQLGGGFARYSTDERWLVPHFEKMLYDNAALADVYAAAFQLTKEPEFSRIARETLDYVAREMQDESGGYYSATDADSEGVEGKYFTWQHDEVVELLGNEAADRFSAYYDVTAEGNWEQTNVLHTPERPSEVATALGISPEALAASLRTSRARLLDARKRRVPPLLDDKILTAWNGLMLRAMALGFRVFGDPAHLASAERAARFLTRELLTSEGRLLRTARGGRAHLAAYLEDYAFLADGLVALYEVSGQAEYLETARALVERMLQDFRDLESHAFFQTAHDHEPLIARHREGHDGAIPSANAIAARALLAVGRHLDREDLLDAAKRALLAYGQELGRLPRAFASSLAVLDSMLEPAIEIVLVGERGADDFEALFRVVSETYLPNSVLALLLGDSANPHSGASRLTQGKRSIDGKATAYVCRNFACDRPTTDPDELRAQLSAASLASSKERGDRLE